MLKNIHLKNLALIKEADIDLDKGLNILTGETGAGKSIIIGSINIALGDKASRSFIRTGADHGLVELSFCTDDARVLEILEKLDIPAEDGNIIISRKITSDGSIARINGQSVTLSNLKQVSSLLVDIHGQHDHQSLLDASKHIDLIDSFGHDIIDPVKQDFRNGYLEYKSLKSCSKDLGRDPEEIAKEISFLEYEINEIETAAIVPGEDEKLEEEYKKLNSSEKISESLNRIYSSLFNDNDGISTRISDSLKELSYLENIDTDLKSFSGYLMDIDSISRDLSHELSHYIDANSFDRERFNEIHKRLDEINRLKARYGKTIDDILKYKDNLAIRLEELKNYEKNKSELKEKLDAIKVRVRKLAASLSEKRKESAAKLQEMITENLKDLNFLDVSFKINIERADKIYENGADKAEFLISLNPGEPLRPLSKIASGGELSRIMLAIKTSTSSQDDIDTLIFDEIDTGISGRTAQKVAQKLSLLSTERQLICITHLAQIASMADVHFSIEKSTSDGSTITGITRLDERGSVLELSRLLSGNIITETTLKNAEELISSAKTYKESISRANM